MSPGSVNKFPRPSHSRAPDFHLFNIAINTPCFPGLSVMRGFISTL
jgi:hypothetical protein